MLESTYITCARVTCVRQQYTGNTNRGVLCEVMK